MTFALWLHMACAAPAPMVCQDNNQELCAAPVSQGEPCPFNGELITYKLALDLKQKADHCAVELREQKKADAADLQLQLKTDQALRRGDQQQFDATMVGCQKQLQEQQKLINRCEPPWWQKPAFVVPVVAFATMISTAFITLQVTR